MVQVVSVTSSIAQDELERILSSRCFRSRKILRQLLSYLIKQLLAGRANQLSQYTIAVEGLGKLADFNATVDPSVRIQMGRLRQQLDEYYASEGHLNPLRIIFPIGSYIPIITPVTKCETALSSPLEKKISMSQGPNIMCIPRNFTQDDKGNWLFICGFTRDYVTALSRFIYCQVIFADEVAWQKKDHSITSWLQSDADFALLFDLYYQHKQYELKCTLVSRLNQQIVWAHNFSLGDQYPSSFLSQQVFKRIAHDTVGAERGIAQNYWVRQLLDSGNPIAPHHQLVVDFRQYAWDISYKKFLEGLRNCEKRLRDYPHDVMALIAFADYCRGEYLLKFNIIKNYRQCMVEVTEKLLQLAPENAYSHLYYAMSCLLEERYLESETAIEKALNINSIDTHLNNLAGLVYLGLDQWDKGSLLIKDSISVSPTYPDWYHIALCVYYYKEGSFLAAIQEAQRIKLKHLWAPMLRTALYQYSGYREKVEEEYQYLVRDYPDFKQDSYKLLQGFNEKVGGVMQQLWGATIGKQPDD